MHNNKCYNIAILLLWCMEGKYEFQQRYKKHTAKKFNESGSLCTGIRCILHNRKSLGVRKKQTIRGERNSF